MFCTLVIERIIREVEYIGIMYQHKETVNRGPKKSFHRKQKNPRNGRKTNWLAAFISNHCQGSEDEYRRVLDRFQSFNDSGNKKEANSMLSVYIVQGAREKMLREVFKIGYERYKKILHNQSDKIGGGRNGFAVSKDMLDQLYRFTMHVPTEFGYPYRQGLLLKYCLDPAVTSWDKLYNLHFVKFEEDNLQVRKMGKSTFFKCITTYHPEFRLKRLH